MTVRKDHQPHIYPTLYLHAPIILPPLSFIFEMNIDTKHVESEVRRENFQLRVVEK